MKKIVSLILALVMIFALAACGQSAAPAATEAPAAAEAPAPVEEPAEEAAPAEEPAPEADALVVDTCILLEADDAMINNYSLLAVNPEAPWVDADGNPVADVSINTVGAAALINWLLSEEGQNLAANYGFEEYGEYLFYLKDGRTSAFPPPPPSTTPVCWVICCPSLRRSTAMRWRSTPPAPASPSPTPRWATPT